MSLAQHLCEQQRSSPSVLQGLATLHPRLRKASVETLHDANADAAMGEVVSGIEDHDNADWHSALEEVNMPPEQQQPAQPQPQPPSAQQQQFTSLLESLKDTPAASLRLVSPNARESLIVRAALIDAMPDSPPK
ncbi:hypothetical protein BWQ96_06253 [Gracilariopsis chorda]|uniref:Uncharacterized protein n=1 Tax=Gracilariopsis chorda TaxID=448386 RepID=A0A2V3ISD9_9FLOR|nr:hypothetical protein BWQ96_06253 [Gracilariopsis chorda]|eukprot:PXF44020.1 hypothetical protein BWQ96_06253 [Gracilariopsis chorda]